MKGKTSNKLLAILSVILIVALVAVPVGAVLKTQAAGTNYETDRSNVQGSEETTTFEKVLKVDNGYKIPQASFNFAIAEGTAVDPTNTTLEVLAGVDADKIVFSSDSVQTSSAGAIDLPYIRQDKTTAANTAAGDYVTIKDGTDYYLAIKTVTLDFSDVEFTEPGVYRYIITESSTQGASNAGVGFDENLTRTLDVYVEDATIKDTTTGAETKLLKIGNYVMYVGTVTNGPSNVTTATTGLSGITVEDDTTKTPNGGEVTGATKSVGFINHYPTAGITFGKEVKGNQGSKDKYFKFTLTLEGAAGSVFDVLLGNADETISANPNDATTCITADVTQPSTISIAANETSVTKDFYLQDGQYITVCGLYEGMTYSIVEDAEDYTSVAGIDAADSNFDIDSDGTNDALSGATSNTTGLTKNAEGKVDSIYTGFTNTKEGLIPTGVVLSVVPWVIAGVVIIGGVVFFAIRSKKKYDEQ